MVFIFTSSTFYTFYSYGRTSSSFAITKIPEGTLWDFLTFNFNLSTYNCSERYIIRVDFFLRVLDA